MAPTTMLPETDSAPITDAEVDAAIESADLDAELAQLLADRSDAPRRPTFEPLEDPRAPWSAHDILVTSSFALLTAATFVLIVLAAFQY